MSQFYVGVAAGALPPSVPLQFTTDSGVAVPAANNLNVFGGVGTTTSGSGSTITVTVVNDSFQWSEKAVSFAASVQNGYFCNAALTVTLPPSGGLIIGNTIIIYVDTPGAVVIQAGAGEFIEVGTVISAVGGTTTSLAQGNMLTLVFKPSDLTWHAISSMGNWNTV